MINEADDTNDDVNDPAGHRRSLSVVKSSCLRNSSDSTSNARIQVQVDPVRLAVVKVSADSAFLIDSLDFLRQTSDKPLLIEDDGETTSETGASTRATSVEPETDTAHLSSFHRREQPKTHDCVNAYFTTSPTITPVDRPTSPGG